jgi:nucleotide-binding universal stress UspA family protein
MTWSRILCPVDGSEISRDALVYAVALARWRSARVHALRVVDTRLPPITAIPEGFAVPDALRTMATEEIARVVAELDAGAIVEPCVTEGEVVGAILEQAAQLDVDVIVIGTHGRGGVQRFLLGSVAAKVLRKADRPVIAVPPGSGAGHAAPFRSIVCATDLSEPGNRAVTTAAALAADAGASLVVLHAVEWPFGVEAGPDPLTELRHNIEAEARDQIAKLLSPGQQRVEVALTTGRPQADILGRAASSSADLLVLGASGRGAVGAGLLGSTADRVIRQAECPVLIVR